MLSQDGVRVALFFGKTTGKVDRKGRVSVPAAWRPDLSRDGFSGVFLFRSFKFEAIEGLDHAQVAEMSQRLASLDRFSDEHDSLAALFADITQLAFDPEGRILLPEHLMAHAGITDAVTFAGKGQNFQIWEPGRWAAHEAEMRELARRTHLSLPGRPAAPRPEATP
jgi:MraZ protein